MRARRPAARWCSPRPGSNSRIATIRPKEVFRVNATPVTFVFNPQDLVGVYSTTPNPGTRVQQENPRRLHESWSSTFFNTWDSGLGTYEKWVASLGEGEGEKRKGPPG
jgi:hypothetical protein